MIRFQMNEEPAATTEGEQKKEPPREHVLTKLLTFLVVGWLKSYQQNTVDLMKIEAASYYIKGVGKARKAFVGHLLLSGVQFLLLAGFLLIHAGLFLYLDWPIKDKALLALGLGAGYFIVALVAILRFCSQKKWMEFSGADEWVSKLTRKS
jgi:hypothetical protein